ncbi:hypothetical protein SAMN04488102_102172 [Alkalibacterium subtropicum]|uniref:Uncharacterized protein n=1 Tax=Alkalibacterium subtropicum TaxID=753702 RepID=A0A1I1FMT2_9LACT|nr:hypothetical protein [Alkalibacterium subtropicum]SFC00591.1 hypothetical protein SAMN04488102_102172 [Alkalibacterium subtropicum]
MLKIVGGIVIATFSLAACENADTAQYAEEVEEASEELSEVDNGRFSVTTSVERDEGAVETETEGVFVMTDEGMDWQSSVVMEGPDSDVSTKTELSSVDSTTYERFGRVDEEGRYIDQDGEVVNDAEWVKAEKDFGSPLEPLLDIDLDESMIDDITKEERDATVVYTVNYSEAFLEQQKEENLSELEDEVERLQDLNAIEQIIQSVEHNIAYQEGLSYEGIVLESVVDNEGVLVQYTLETEVQESVAIQPDSEPGRMTTTNKIVINDYDDPGIEVMLDEME